MRILVTGSEGLVGKALTGALRRRGHEVLGLDLTATHPGDVRDRAMVRRAARGCDGTVHLAAVSRVAWAEADPVLCDSTNIGGTRNVLDATRGWLLFASSREVYGQRGTEPTPESAPLEPLNVYGRAKVEGERQVLRARRGGRPATIVRLSNVYGAPDDHADRVVPAFLRAGLAGEPLRVDGPANAFDFVFLDDAVDGLCRVIDRLAGGDPPPTVQLVTGVSTTLGTLAEVASAVVGAPLRTVVAPPRDFDVSTFCGDPTLARRELGWEASVPLTQGLERLRDALVG